MKKIDVLFSSNSDHWSTPSFIYDQICSNGFFDPCPLHSSFDGLSIDWPSKCFVNPPYSLISKFVDKSIREALRGNLIVLLVPARTDTRWFRKLVNFSSVSFKFITGRLKFGNSNRSAPFPSCLVYLDFGSFPSAWVDRDKLVV